MIVSVPHSPAPPPPGTPWRLEHRDETGLFVVSSRGTLLFRIDLSNNTIYPFDKKGRCEVPVRLEDLITGQIRV